MATVGQIYYNIVDTNSGGYISNWSDIFNDIVQPYGATRFGKLGVQAPPGTKIIMNGSKAATVGRTGIYELDDAISITSLYFDRPKTYVKDVQTSEQYIDDGTRIMTEADSERTVALNNFFQQNPVIPDRENQPEEYKLYWDRYNEIQSTYIEKYQQGLGLYNQGINGVYTLPYPSDISNPANYKDLYNIIVDFVYE